MYYTKLYYAHACSYSQSEIKNKPTAITEEVLKSKSRTNIKQKGSHAYAHSITFYAAQCMACTIYTHVRSPFLFYAHYIYIQQHKCGHLLCNLHVTIGDLIREGDIYWDTFLTLLDILDICMAQVVSNDMAAHLNLLIHDHHEAYREIYPDKPLLPKQHYMVHYPDWMKK